MILGVGLVVFRGDLLMIGIWCGVGVDWLVVGGDLCRVCCWVSGGCQFGFDC